MLATEITRPDLNIIQNKFTIFNQNYSSDNEFIMNEKEFFIYLSIHYQDRLRVRFKKEKGHIFDMIMQYEALINDRWTPIVRYDCAHGFFHRDLIHPNGTEEKKIIKIPNMKFGLKFAKEDLKDRWEWYKVQYLKKLKDDK